MKKKPAAAKGKAKTVKVKDLAAKKSPKGGLNYSKITVEYK